MYIALVIIIHVVSNYLMLGNLLTFKFDCKVGISSSYIALYIAVGLLSLVVSFILDRIGN